MEVLFHNKTEQGGLQQENGRGVFILTHPVILQPGEIKKVTTGTTIKPPVGTVILISTPESLYNRALEIFPAVLVITHTAPDKPLEIPIRNSGRNQINLKEGEVIANADLIAVQDLALKEFTPTSTTEGKSRKTQPQRKNSDITFEIR